MIITEYHNNEKPPYFEAYEAEKATLALIERLGVSSRKKKNDNQIVAFIEKLKSLNEYKSQMFIEKLNKKDDSFTPEDQLVCFYIDPLVENKLIDLIINMKDISYGPIFQPFLAGEHHKVKAIGELDILYRVLEKIEFHLQDINGSFEATCSNLIEDHFDWLLINTKPSRFPAKFFKNYVSVRKNKSIIIPDSRTTSAKKTKTVDDDSNESEEYSVVYADDISGEMQLLERKDTFSYYSGSIKTFVSNYAEKKMRYKNNINKEHAKLRIQLEKIKISNLQGKLGTSNRLTTDQESILDDAKRKNIQTRKLIKTLKDHIENLEIDPDFNQSASDESYRYRKYEETKERCLEISKRKEENRLQKFQKKKSIKNKVNSLVKKMDWKIVKLEVSSSIKCRLPRDILMEHCRKKKIGNAYYQTTNADAGIWISGVEVYDPTRLSSYFKFGLPENMAASNKNDAIQLVSLYALHSIDPETLAYLVLPQCYKDIWKVWHSELIKKEKFPTVEQEVKKFQLLIQVYENSFERPNKALSILNDKTEDEPGKPMEHLLSKNYLRKQNELFLKRRDMFLSRQKTPAYLDMKNKRKKLPISGFKEIIINYLKTNTFIVIPGETGCGKSTQVPQFIVEDLLENGTHKGMVICTQPRRVSTMSIANRVSQEMGDPPRSTGSPDALVGYLIKRDSKISIENVLVFCTSGTLLKRLENDKFLRGTNYVIVDEVHERTIETDLILMILRKICSIRTDLKVILMSATTDTRKISEYFGKCPILTIPGRTYPVEKFFLDDVIRLTKFKLTENPYDTKTAFQNRSDATSDIYDPQADLRIKRTINNMGLKKINFNLIQELLGYICVHIPLELKRKKSNYWDIEDEDLIPAHGAILIFLPGLGEIRKLYDLLNNHECFGNPLKYLIVPLHSALTASSQEKIFNTPPSHIRKIVLSTNIAETGVTISDVTIVIDTGMARVVNYDRTKKITSLVQQYVAKANIEQRSGRAGRIQQGVSFHLFSKTMYNDMPDFQEPEICRLPLHETSLRMKAIGLGEVRHLFESMLDRPEVSVVEESIKTLQEVQALDENEDLTALGVHLCHLPVDIHIGKMIIYGVIFKCLDPILTIAAILSTKSPFIRPFGKEEEAKLAREQFKWSSSDFLTAYKAYDVWRQETASIKKLYQNNHQARMHYFCKENYLSQSNLVAIEESKSRYLELLVSIGFVTIKDDFMYDNYDFQFCKIPPRYNQYERHVAVINAAISAGMYPKLARRYSLKGKFKDESSILTIHESSVVSWEDNSKEFLIYNTVMMNPSNKFSKITMWETAWIDTIDVMLFSNMYEIKYKKGEVIIDNWITIECSTKTAVLVKFLRQQINYWLAKKIKNVSIDSKEVLDMLVMVLEAREI